jgi:CheY-like chemotaxis protein
MHSDIPGVAMASKKKVLIVEDYADIREMTRIMIEMIGYDVVEAANGYEAIRLAKETRPDVVLMDIAMPELNGITAATMIHQLAECCNTPIIAITAFGKQYVDEASEYGFDAVIEKPVDIDDLKLVLDSRLDRSQAVTAN